ncbi:MAG: NAD-dependent epimerase/dehydratase family protein [Phycisphaerales bacterium]
MVRLEDDKPVVPRNSKRIESATLLTGAGGYLGSTLTPMLVKSGHRVIAHDLFPHGCSRLKRTIKEQGLEGQIFVEQGDIRNLDSNILQNVDQVIHLAGLSNDASCQFDPAWSREINFEATARLGDLCKEHDGIQMVFASSCSVYGASETELLTEDSKLGPLSVYAETKADSENALRNCIGEDFGVVCLRMGTLFGSSTQMRFDLVANQMALCATRDGTVKVGGGGSQWRPMLHVQDAANVFIEALTRRDLGRKGAILNVVGDNYQIKGLGELIGQALDAKVEILNGEVDPRNYRVSRGALEEVLSYRPSTTIAQSSEEICNRLGNNEYGDPAQDRYYPTRTAQLIYESHSAKGHSNA